jgi:hypothetical protein
MMPTPTMPTPLHHFLPNFVADQQTAIAAGMISASASYCSGARGGFTRCDLTVKQHQNVPSLIRQKISLIL